MPSVVLARRSFLIGLGLGGGLAVGVTAEAAADEPAGGQGPGPRPASPSTEASVEGLNPNVLVHVARDGTTTIVCHRSEMGQGVRSTIPLLIADELGADPARVVVRQAAGDKKYGDQNTDGSTSIRKFYDDLRTAGAVARTMLVAAAAKTWGVPADRCTAAQHRVTHVPTKRVLRFEELVAAASKLPVPDKKSVVLRPESELVHVRASAIPLLDGPAYVTGAAIFGADVRVPGMLVAVVARPPVVGGKVRRFDAAAARAIRGVRHVVEIPAPTPPWKFQAWGGVAVVADDTWSAMRGRAALEIEWDHGPNESYASRAFREELLASVRAPGVTVRAKGDVDQAMTTAATVVEAEYVVPHLSHMQMEPLVALVRFENGRAEVWAPTQNPQAARAEVARVLGIAEEQVTVNVTLLGGGFGRKSKADFVAEAAHLAKAVGAPVRVQWTREDDVRHGYYNAANAQRLRAGLDARGNVVAWHHRTALTPIRSLFAPDADIASEDDLQQGVLDLALSAPNVRAEACRAPAHARIGWFRSVYNIFHAFAVGSFIDEIAHARRADPRDVWLEVTGPSRRLGLEDLGVKKLVNYREPLDKHPVDAGRLRGVVERVTEMCGWRDRRGRALGLAAHRSFVSYVGVVIAVVRDAGRVRIDEAWITIDAGTVVNEDRVHAQLEGALVMGISNALYGGITMTAGASDQTNFRDARVARIADVPRRIHTDILRSTAPPGGVGEPGVPPVGAALANAIFALTGKRIREIPLARALA